MQINTSQPLNRSADKTCLFRTSHPRPDAGRTTPQLAGCLAGCPPGGCCWATDAFWGMLRPQRKAGGDENPSPPRSGSPRFSPGSRFVGSELLSIKGGDGSSFPQVPGRCHRERHGMMMLESPSPGSRQSGDRAGHPGLPAAGEAGNEPSWEF